MSDSNVLKPKIYPVLPEPSAPQEMNSDPLSFRLAEISRNKKEIYEQAQHYRGVLKKYKKARKIIHYTVLGLGGLTTLLSSGSIAAAFTGVGVVVAIPVGALAAIFGGASTGLTAFNKKIEKKIEKHTRIHALALSKLDSINDKISEALNDNKVSDSEFKNISQEVRNYSNLRDRLRKSFYDNKSKKITTNQPPAIDRQKIYKEIHDQVYAEAKTDIIKKMAAST